MMLHHWRTMMSSSSLVWMLMFCWTWVSVVVGLVTTDVPTAVPPDSLVLDPGVTPGLPTDLSYCQMLLEAPQPPSADQVPWFCMCSTCPNNHGEKGERGDRGPPGRPGSPGPRGIMGIRGPPGLIGRQGIKGDKGDKGMKGDQGMTGLQGTKGASGMKGDKGDPGADGPAGDPGPKGDDGQCPENCESIPGPPGTPGLPGPVGLPGTPGLKGEPGLKGMKGDPGLTGKPGVPGTPGEKGEQGVEGQCNCKDGAKGEPGPKGPKGEQGEQGVAGPQGVTGETGPKGEQGDTGLTGMPGPCSPLVQSAFSVALTASYPPPNFPVIFSRIIYNLQQHYEPSNGIYTAPVNGTYAFSYHLVASGRVLKVGLFHNYSPVVKSTETSELGSISQQVTLHMSAGDRVWLQVRDSTSNGMYTSPEFSSTFSGFLLQPDSCDLELSRDFQLPPNTEAENNREYTWGELP